MKMILIIFEKKLVWGKWTILGPKMAHPHNFGSAVRIFFKFCSMKRVNRKMKVIIMLCSKKNCSGQMGHFGPENGTSYNCIRSKNSFKILQNEGG